MSKPGTQRDKAIRLLRRKGMVRLLEFRRAGVTAATISRMTQTGDLLRLARGLYMLPDARLEGHHSLAEATRRVPRGVVCLVSALIFHDLTDQMPRDVWMAIGQNDWAPKAGRHPVRIVRFIDRFLADDIITVKIEGVPVRIFDVARTVADCFRFRGTIGLPIALEGLQDALRDRKATAAELARYAQHRGVFNVMQPYLETLTFNG